MTELERILYLISDALTRNPHPSLVYAARYVLAEYDSLPDWVRVLAGGNPDKFEAVVDETLRWKKAEEEENAGDDDSF